MHEELKQHVLGLLAKGTRLDGRGMLDYRQPIEVSKGYIKSADGSAQVKIGETVVIAGVKLEAGTPYPDTPDQGGIIVGVELLPLSNPDFEMGPPSIQAVELARVVDRGIRESKAVDFEALCIESGVKVWNVIIDICTINDDGNLFDACSLAALAALQDTTFPTFDGKKVDYKTRTGKKLPMKKQPIAITVYKIGEHLLVDPDSEEGQVYDARLSVAVEEKGILCAMQKGGEMPLTDAEVMQMVDIAVEKASELRKHL